MICMNRTLSVGPQSVPRTVNKQTNYSSFGVSERICQICQNCSQTILINPQHASVKCTTHQQNIAVQPACRQQPRMQPSEGGCPAKPYLVTEGPSLMASAGTSASSSAFESLLADSKVLVSCCCLVSTQSPAQLEGCLYLASVFIGACSCQTSW